MTEEQKRAKAAERQRKCRARKKRLDEKPSAVVLARGERRMVAANAAARGFEDQTEYVFSLVMADRKRLEAEGCDVSRFDELAKA